MSTELTRRETLAVALALSGGIAMAEEKREAPKRSLVPLAFDPKKLKGLSEKLLVSHWENNYGGAFKNLARVEEELSHTNKDTPAFLVAAMRERELTFNNSVVLHELYFGNLGGGGGAPTGSLGQALSTEFGSTARFEELFRAAGAGLGGGSGWVTLDVNLRDGSLHVHGSGHHTQQGAMTAPLLVMDMYEHSYALDYGAAAAKYVDAFFANIQWDSVAARHERALKAVQALR
ncbi:MAG: Fe-Mn family superoxide dismutase [Archangium sp.]